MTEFQTTVIAILNSAITSTPVKISDNIDWEGLLKYGKKSQIVPMLYYGLKNSGIRIPEEIQSKMEMIVFSNVSIDCKQRYWISRIAEEFEKNEIDHMLLKGTLLKNIYPKPEMRPMGDADILIRIEQYEKIVPIMENLGFSNVKISDHDFSWSTPQGLYLELHRRLIPSYNKDYYAYYGDGWQLAQKSDSSDYSYYMSNEDMFIYLFTHFAKHYRDAGIGIRHIFDLWVYKRSVTLDESYIKSELKKLQLYVFYKNIIKTLDSWFSGGIEDEVTLQITDTVFNSGAFGSGEVSNVSVALRASTEGISIKKHRFQKITGQIFPGFAGMSFKYSVLNKCPILLPVFWVVRWFEVFLFKSDKAKQFYKGTVSTTDQKVSAYEQKLKSVGLSFTFEEKKN